MGVFITSVQMPLPVLLLSAEAAKVMGLSRRQFGRLVAAGEVKPAAVTPKGHKLFDPREVAACRRPRRRFAVEIEEERLEK